MKQISEIEKNQQREHTLKTMYCQNKKLTESYINTYQSSMKTTIESVLKIGECIRDIKLKQKNKELNYYDLQYFCSSVGINEDSSTFRKFQRIGEKCEDFKKYLNLLPSSYTVLYEITTLDPELFETLISQNQINPSITLKELKRISGKVSSVKKSPKPVINNSSTHRNQVVITVLENISLDKLNLILNFLKGFDKQSIIKLDISKNLEDLISDKDMTQQEYLELEE
jgi:uncharacterized protein YnzC (UPF0291/DUF896 family)